ncbi:hypothetical protein GGF32_004636 [Allomyces javanicus]|nr:hypothetical protein GGF32_004636 [Allomyces javanicus]
MASNFPSASPIAQSPTSFAPSPTAFDMIPLVATAGASSSVSPSTPHVPMMPEPPRLRSASASVSTESLQHPWLSEGLTHRLSNSRKSPEELKQLRKTSGASGKKVVQFYEEQNELIDDLLAPIADNSAEQADTDRKVTMAVQLSLGTNVVLFCCQVTAASLSGSLSLLGTATDAFMDLLSGMVLLLADRAAKRQNVLDYPTGKKRYETIGIIVFSCLMAALSLQLVIQGVTTLVAFEEKIPTMSWQEIVLICVALCVKVALFFYCYALRRSNTAKTLATDHSNDLTLNTFGLTMALLGTKVIWWIDPIGAIVIGLLILRSWSASAWENIQLLVGRSAPPAFLNKITYIAATHHAKIRQVDTCKAYYLGNSMFVEVDIVLPPEMTLHESHDIGESLQKKLEMLPNVERAFVHCDYEFDHRPEH